MLRVALVAVTLAVSASIAWAQVTVVRTFPGQNGPNQPETPVPSADMMGGVSPRFLVGFINAGFSVRSKVDGKEIQPLQTLRQFWEAAFRNAGGQLVGSPYDPRTFFDPLSGRWFATSNAMTVTPAGRQMGTHALIAVSTDADPTHPWKAADLQTRVPVDNTKLGLDRNGFYTCALPAGSQEATIKGAMIAIPKADLLWKGASAPSLAHVNFIEVEESRLGDKREQGAGGMMPAFDLDRDKRPGDPAIFVNRYRTEPGGETMIQVRKVTWSSPTTATLSRVVEVGLGAHHSLQPTSRGIQPALPEGLYAPGLAAGEGRLVNAVVSHGSVWTIAATEVGNRVGAFWVQIDLATLKPVQHGTLADPEADLLFPSLNVDGRGNLGIAMIRTSATEAASTYVTGRLRTDPPNTLRPLVRAVEGRYPFFHKTTDLTKPGQGVPTSDYSTTVVDPADATLFWSYQLAATNDCMPQDTNGGRYGTHWVAFRVGAAPK